MNPGDPALQAQQMQPYLPPLQFLNDAPSSDEPEEAGMRCEVSQFERMTNAKGEKVTLRSGSSRAGLAIASREPLATRSAMVLIRDLDKQNYPHIELEIQSPHMKAALKECVPEFSTCDIARKPIVLTGPPRCLFHFRDALIKYHQRCVDNNQLLTATHVKFLLDHMFNTLSSEIRHFSRFVQGAGEKPGLDFVSLWMAFVPGELVYVLNRRGLHHKLRGSVFRLQSMTRCPCTRQWCSQFSWTLAGYVIDYDGKDFGHTAERVMIDPYEGVRALQDLPVIPFKYHPERDTLESYLTERGKNFVALSSPTHRYQQYQGVAELLSDSRNLTAAGEDDWFPLRSTQVNGRIVIDGKAFCEARPICEPYLESTKKVFRTERDQHLSMSNQELMICSNVVTGYSLDQKKWGYFGVDHCSDPQFSQDAFDSLIFQEEYKRMMLSLVKSHAREMTNFDDIIKGKGRGLVFLLYGDPGTGKTLTAGLSACHEAVLLEHVLTTAPMPLESLAEHTKMPLLRMDTATLGSSMVEIEENLSSTFRAAERWNALVLLDEADVFLEERKYSDLERNRLVAVFLRVLEYFEGIMFLTTNRIEAFDRAFKSRIHLTLHYPPLNPESCGKVLRNFLTRADANADPDLLNSDRLSSLVKAKLNGRQIKNAVHIASALAASEGLQISIRHLEVALSANCDFEDTSKGPADIGDRAVSRREAGTVGEGGEEDGLLSSLEGEPPRKRQRKGGE